MIHLASPTVMRIPAAELAPRARERFGGELRRTGGFAQLCMLGAQACLDQSNSGKSVGVLWSSSRGPVSEVRAVLVEEPVMPFSFIAVQPHLAATLLAQRGVPVARAAFVRIADDGWPWLLAQAAAWLASCERVLLGRVEEGEIHQSDWCLVQREARGVSCEPCNIGDALPANAQDWLARVAIAREPLALRGASEAWRFTSA